MGYPLGSSCRTWITLITLATAVIVPGGAATTRAALLAYDDFETYAATDDVAGNNGGSGWAGAWAGQTAPKVEAGGLDYSGGAVSVPGGANNVLLDNTNNAGLLTRQLSAATAAATEVWFSLTVNPSTTSGDFLYFYLTNAVPTTNPFLNSGGIGLFGGTTYGARAHAGTSSASTTVNNSTAPSESTVFLVGRFFNSATFNTANGNLDTIELFVNPTSQSLGAPDATAQLDSGINSVSFFGVRTSALDSGDAPRFDEVRIGTSADDVVPIAVPEPAAVGMAGIAGASAMLGRRRRRRPSMMTA